MIEPRKQKIIKIITKIFIPFKLGDHISIYAPAHIIYCHLNLFLSSLPHKNDQKVVNYSFILILNNNHKKPLPIAECLRWVKSAIQLVRVDMRSTHSKISHAHQSLVASSVAHLTNVSVVVPLSDTLFGLTARQDICPYRYVCIYKKLGRWRSHVQFYPLRKDMCRLIIAMFHLWLAVAQTRACTTTRRSPPPPPRWHISIKYHVQNYALARRACETSLKGACNIKRKMEILYFFPLRRVRAFDWFTAAAAAVKLRIIKIL